MQKEILKLQEQNTTNTENILESSFTSQLRAGPLDNWRRSLEQEITVIKVSNANMMTMMRNITLITGMASLLHAGCGVGRTGSSTPLAKLGQKPSSDEQTTRARFCLLVHQSCPGTQGWTLAPDPLAGELDTLGDMLCSTPAPRACTHTHPHPLQILLHLHTWLWAVLPCVTDRLGLWVPSKRVSSNHTLMCSSLSADY